MLHGVHAICSTWVIMNRETRRLSKIPEQVKQEVIPFYLNRLAIPDAAENDVDKIDKLTDGTAERIRSGLAVSHPSPSPPPLLILHLMISLPIHFWE